MAIQISTILKNANLRVTECRLDVLDIFSTKNVAISHSFIESELQKKHDRVTLYRTIYSFLEKGIIHKVLDEGGSAKYALCNGCETLNHHHDHVHFKCNTCQETFCLNDIIIPKINIPDGFSTSEIGILIQGKCKNC